METRSSTTNPMSRRRNTILLCGVIGLMIGTAIGTAFGVWTDNGDISLSFLLGPGVGISMGIVFGWVFDALKK